MMDIFSGTNERNIRRRRLYSLFTAIAVVLVLALSAFAFPVSAALDENKRQALIDLLEEGIADCDTEIDISSLGITEENKSEVENTVEYVRRKNPQFFHMKSSYSLSIRSDSLLTAVNMGYLYETKAEYQTKLSDYYRRIGAITALVPSGYSDAEKAIFVHDYICENSRYDGNLAVNPAICIYDAYNFLVNGTGVCQAYAYTYKAILNSLGIECEYVTSEAMNHGWNIVKIGGEWYHVDVTWDDPVLNNVTYEEAGVVSHEMCFLSDAKMLTLNHFAWEAEYECTSTVYDNAFFRTVETPLTFIPGTAGNICVSAGAMGNPSVYGYGLSDTMPDVIYTSDANWGVFGNPGLSYGPNKFLSVALYKRIVIVNTPTELYAVDIGTAERKTYKIADITDATGYIYCDGLFCDAAGNVTYYLRTDYNSEISGMGSINIDEWYKANIESPVAKAKGDCDGDGMITASDAVRIADYLSNSALYPLSAEADVNGDGATDMDDAVYLLRYTFEPERYPIK